MKQYSSFIICILTVAALFTNFACSSKPNPQDITVVVTPQNEREVGERVTFHRSKRPPVIHRGAQPGTKPQAEVEPKLSCSHQVGSTVRQGESIRLTYKTTNASLDVTLTLTAGRLGYDGESINLPQQIAHGTNKVEICWGEDNCFVATKNRDGSWTIKSLPFQ